MPELSRLNYIIRRPSCPNGRVAIQFPKTLAVGDTSVAAFGKSWAAQGAGTWDTLAHSAADVQSFGEVFSTKFNPRAAPGTVTINL